MKPAPFKYCAPTTVEEALAHLAEHGYDAKPLAGGQSLVPTMNFRLSQPAVLVDLNDVSELAYIRPDNGSGGLRLGAMTRQVQVEHNALVAERAPLFHGAMPSIGFRQTRNRGTIGGDGGAGRPFPTPQSGWGALGAGDRVLPRTVFHGFGRRRVIGRGRVAAQAATQWVVFQRDHPPPSRLCYGRYRRFGDAGCRQETMRAGQGGAL
jgi:CO/xanthine dehydrogenase FAD-binding subunit